MLTRKKKTGDLKKIIHKNNKTGAKKKDKRIIELRWHNCAKRRTETRKRRHFELIVRAPPSSLSKGWQTTYWWWGGGEIERKGGRDVNRGTWWKDNVRRTKELYFFIYFFSIVCLLVKRQGRCFGVMTGIRSGF